MPIGYSFTTPLYESKLWRLSVIISLFITTICAGSKSQTLDPPPYKDLAEHTRNMALAELAALPQFERKESCEKTYSLTDLEKFIPSGNKCNEVDAAGQVKFGANILSLCKNPQKAVSYLKNVQKSCPQIAACLLVSAIDVVESIESSRQYDWDIVESGILCTESKQSNPTWIEQPFFEEVTKIYKGAQKRILILKRKATERPRWSLGVPMIAIGAGLLGGAITLAYFAETRTQLPQPWPTSCTSPLGVANDPCIGDFRSSYIPMMAGGLALTIGGGLVIGIGHEWFYKDHPADSQPSGSGGKTP